MLRHSAFLVCALLLIGCSSSSTGDEPTTAPTEPAAADPQKEPGTPGTAAQADPAAKAKEQGKTEGNPDIPEQDLPITIDPSPTTHPEVVYVLMTSDRGYGFCTGTLIAADKVITAGHCLQPLFNSWSVVAPNAPGSPRVQVIQKDMYDAEWDEPGHPDLGILKLASPIALPAYAELTDISARIDAKQDTKGVSVVRMMVKPEAPLKKTAPLPISSTADLGYTHGIGVPLFSAGGDSGGGMFLIEKGGMTHKLIGIIREPEPSRQIDHLTKIEPAFIQWVAGL
jgi:hypothetical protein